MPDKIPPRMLGQNQGLGQSQNLINQIRVEKLEPISKAEGFYKSIILDVLAVMAAFFMGCAYFLFLQGTWPFIVPVCAFLILTVATAMEALLEGSLKRRIEILILEAVVLLVPFYATDVRLLATCAVIVLIFFLIGYLQSRSELDHGTTVRFFRSTHGVTAKTVTAMLLVAIILYLPMASAGKFFIGEPEFGAFFDWAAGLIGNFYPAISFTGSLDDFAQSVAKNELAGAATFTALSPANQSAAILAGTGQIEENLSKSLGVTLSSSSPMSDVAYAAIKNMLQSWSVRFSIWFLAGWALAVFLILRSVGVLVVWVSQFLTMIVYEMLLSSGAIRIVEQPQTKEVIEF
ncbi:MAG: hypothetical protein WCF77_04460 [Minisyncoccia bacterium]